VILCYFAPFLKNLGFFLCQEINDLSGKKKEKIPLQKNPHLFVHG
jgi:hypothetical protein